MIGPFKGEVKESVVRQQVMLTTLTYGHPLLQYWYSFNRHLNGLCNFNYRDLFEVLTVLSVSIFGTAVLLLITTEAFVYAKTKKDYWADHQQDGPTS